MSKPYLCPKCEVVEQCLKRLTTRLIDKRIKELDRLQGIEYEGVIVCQDVNTGNACLIGSAP
jgi:hypothetical protein